MKDSDSNTLPTPLSRFEVDHQHPLVCVQRHIRTSRDVEESHVHAQSLFPMPVAKDVHSYKVDNVCQGGEKIRSKYLMNIWVLNNFHSVGNLHLYQ